MFLGHPMSKRSSGWWCTVVLFIHASLMNRCLMARAWSAPKGQSLTQLVQQHQPTIQLLKQSCQERMGAKLMSTEPYCHDAFFLRYCLEPAPADDVTPTDRVDRLQQTLSWRLGAGQAICQAAAEAVQQATTATSWKNDPVYQAAPFIDRIGRYITPSNVITTTTARGDLVYCIRAGNIDDADLMKAVSVEELTQFFLYAKEVNALVANQRSTPQNRLVLVMTANDLAGVKLVGGSADFRKALAASSRQASELYPATAGPTLLLNLPILLNALVQLFTPLFPPAVKERLKFQQGPLKDVEDLRFIAPGGSQRAEFMRQLDAALYKES